MQRFRTVTKSTVSAVILGVVALITNGVSYVIISEPRLPAGMLFLFWAAGALGIRGAFISSFIALTLDAVLYADLFEVVRLLSLFLTIGLLADRQPRIPMYLVTLGLWWVFFGPVLHSLSSTGVLPSYFGVGELFLIATSEVFLSLIAGSLLLSPSLWASLTNRPRPLSVASVLEHILPLLATTAMLAAMMLPSSGTGMIELAGKDLSLASALYLSALSVLLPAVLGWGLAGTLKSHCQDLFPGSLLPQGRPHGFSGASSEFWRRKEALAAGPSSGEPISASLQRTTPAPFPADQGICALNRDGTITFVNRRFLALAEVTTPEPLGKRIHDITMHAVIREHITQLVERTLARGPRVTELKLNSLPNKLRFFEIASLRPDTLESSSIADGPNSVIIVLKDITERRTVESHLLQGQKLESLGALVRGVAQSFRETLQRIAQHTETARKSEKPNEVHQELDEIRGATVEADNLVSRLLDFAEGRPTLIENADLGEIVQERLELLRRMVGDGIDLRYERPSIPIPVTCDPNLLTQAVANLVLNSREAYGEQGGRVSIMLETEQMDEDIEDYQLGARAGNYARLRVRDHGAGMSAETLARAFEPLFTTKAASGHTGLGMSIVFSIVRAHDGFLTVESKPEKGTTVSLYLPLDRVVGAERAVEAPMQEPPPLPSEATEDVTVQ